MPAHRVLFIFGTRPEAIKLVTVVREFRKRSELDVRVCVTAQHRELLDEVLRIFDVTPDYDLNAMRPGQSLPQSTGRILRQLEPVVCDNHPDLIVVQGDTTTTLCGALAGFYADVPVGHVEAGLRTGHRRQPFPEEMNRVLVSQLAAVHFATTSKAAANLYAEGIRPETVHVTGSSGIDAVLYVRDALAEGRLDAGNWSFLDPSKHLLLVTAHRRESFGAGLQSICAALRCIAEMPGVEVVYPLHPNPNVVRPVQRMLCDYPNIHLIEPLDYISFVDLMQRAHFLLTDSGGIQEEATALGKPVLVMREWTERSEAVDAGVSALVGTNTRTIVENADWLLNDSAEYERRARVCHPFGDGHASERIADILLGSGPGCKAPAG